MAKKRVPRTPSAIENFLVKKYVIHDSGTRPDARESTANRRQSLRRIVREAGDMVGQIDFFMGGAVGFLTSCPVSSSSDRSPSASTASSSMDAGRSVCLGTSGSHRSVSSRLKASFTRPRKA